MGWTTTADYERNAKGVFTIKEYLDREFSNDNPKYVKEEILASSLHRNKEYYAALRMTNCETGRVTVLALVVFVSYKPNDPDGHTLGWRDMTETAHPYCYNCPERILALLDPPLNDNAAEWRRLCREQRATARDARKALRHGTVVRFDDPMTFRGGVVRQQFTVEKHGRTLRFRGQDGVLCQIPKAATRPFSVIAA